MSKTVTAIYDNYTSAEHAISVLERNGVSEQDLSILASENAIDKKITIQSNSKAPEGVSIGAGVGGAVGATIAGLSAVGAVTLTGGLGLVAAGPAIAAFAGAGVGAGTGGFIGGLVGLGIPETEAKVVDEKLANGHVLVGVTVDKNKDEIKSLLKNTKPQDITVH